MADGYLDSDTNLSTPVSVADGGTGSTSFTVGSVIFSDGSILTEDNASLFWDDTNNRLGVGTATPLAEVHVVGTLDVVHAAASSDDHALEIDVDASGFADVKALDITFKTGTLAAGEEDEAILLSIDESASTGGTFKGYEVLTTEEGSAVVYGYSTGVNVNPILHKSGGFVDIDDILNKAVDVTAALASGGAGAISAFVADNDTMTFGDAAIWDEMEFIVGTAASGAGINPTFEYSTGGAGFSAFVPADGTNGLRFSGVIDWESGDLAGWATNASGLFEIRMTRTRNVLGTTPILDEVQLTASTEYVWDKNGDVNVKSISFDAGSNSISNYTEGSWTPGIDGSSTSPTVNLTVVGKYTRIGDMCQIKCVITINTISGGSGNVEITGLPFTSANDGINNYGPIRTGGVSFDGAGDILAQITPNNNVINISGYTDNGGGSTVDIDDLSNTDTIYINMTYWV